MCVVGFVPCGQCTYRLSLGDGTAVSHSRASFVFSEGLRGFLFVRDGPAVGKVTKEEEGSQRSKDGNRTDDILKTCWVMVRLFILVFQRPTG